MVMYKIKRGCPLCQSDLRGNEDYKFFCSSCDLLFDRKDIHYAPEEKKELSKKDVKQVTQDFEMVEKKKGLGIKEKKEEKKEINLPDLTKEPEKPKEEPKIEAKREPDEFQLIGSDQSGKVHVAKCHFVKKIQDDRRIYFSSADEAIAKEYEPCVCLRKLMLKQKG